MSNQQFKADGGKARPDLLEVGFARALRMVQATMEYGAIKYEAHSWRKVDDAKARYVAAAERHRQARMLENMDEDHQVLGPTDDESGLPHIAHEVFCLLAIMELDYAEIGLCISDVTTFNDPPLAHKG